MKIVFLVICFVLDIIATTIFKGQLQFSFSFSLIGMCYYITDMLFSDAFIHGWLIGFIYGLLNVNYVFAYGIIFLLVSIVYRVWKKYITDSIVETLVFFTAIIAIKEVIHFGIFKLFGITSIPLMIWINEILIIALIANIVPIFIVDRLASYFIK